MNEVRDVSERDGQLEYMIEFGNSSVGQIGFVARVWATSRQEAIDKLKATMPESQDMNHFDDSSDFTYAQIYFGYDNLTVDLIEEASDADGNDYNVAEMVAWEAQR